MRLWRLPHAASAACAQQQCVGILRGHVSNVFSSVFVPGSGDQRLVTGGNDGTCRLYDVNTQTQLSIMCHHFRKVPRDLHVVCGTSLSTQVLCCSPLDFNTVLTCSADGTVYLLDLRQPPSAPPPPANRRIVPQALGGGAVDPSHSTPGRPLLNMRQSVYAVDWNRSKGYEFVAASGWGDLRVFDIRRGDGQVANDWRLLFKGRDRDEVTGCAWSKDGRRLVGTWLNGSAYTFNVDDGITHGSLVLERAAEFGIDPRVVSSHQSNRFHCILPCCHLRSTVLVLLQTQKR